MFLGDLSTLSEEEQATYAKHVGHFIFSRFLHDHTVTHYGLARITFSKHNCPAHCQFTDHCADCQIELRSAFARHMIAQVGKHLDHRIGKILHDRISFTAWEYFIRSVLIRPLTRLAKTNPFDGWDDAANHSLAQTLARMSLEWILTAKFWVCPCECVCTNQYSLVTCFSTSLYIYIIQYIYIYQYSSINIVLDKLIYKPFNAVSSAPPYHQACEYIYIYIYECMIMYTYHLSLKP